MISKSTAPDTDPAVTAVRDAFNELEDMLKAAITPGRRFSLAMTHLETASMYAIKAATVGDK